MELPQPFSFINLRIQSQNYSGNEDKTKNKVHYTKAVGKNRRDGRLRLPSDPSGKTLFSSSSKATTLPLHIKGPQLQPTLLVKSFTNKLDRFKHHSPDNTSSPHPLPTIHLDRRLSPRLGGAYTSDDQISVRHLVDKGIHSPHKHPVGPGRGQSYLHSTLPSLLNTHCHRQQLYNRDNTKTRIKSPQNPEESRAPFQGSSIPEHRANTYPCSRPPQCRRRLIISNTASKHRMGTLTNRVQTSVPTRNRPFCLSNKPQTPSVHVSIPTYRRFHGKLEQMENILPVSTYQSPTQSNLKPNDVPRYGTNNTPIQTNYSLVPCSHTQVLNTQPPRTTLPDRPRRTNKHPIHLLRALGRSDFLSNIPKVLLIPHS